MSKLSKAEILAILENSSDDELIDIDELTRKAKEKARIDTSVEYAKGDAEYAKKFQEGVDYGKSDYNPVGQALDSAKESVKGTINNAFESEMEIARACAGETHAYTSDNYGPKTKKFMKNVESQHEELKSLDVFSNPDEDFHRKDKIPNKKQGPEHTPEEAEEAIQTLLAHGIRERNYAQVQLGLLSYADYLKSKPELLAYQRARAVIKNIFGYNGFGQSTPKKSKVVILKHMLIHAQGNNKEFELWLQNVGKPKSGSNWSGRKVDFVKYMDTAIKYIDDYFNLKFKDKIGVAESKDYIKRLVQQIVLIMIEFGYNPNQILYAILRKTKTPRGYKQTLLGDWYSEIRNSSYINTVSSALIDLEVVGDLSPAEHNSVVQIERLIDSLENEESDICSEQYEELVCPRCKELGELKKKANVIYGMNSLQYGKRNLEMEAEMRGLSAEEYKKKFDERVTNIILKYAKVFNNDSIKQFIKDSYEDSDVFKLVSYAGNMYHNLDCDEGKTLNKYRELYGESVKEIPNRIDRYSEQRDDEDDFIVMDTVNQFKWGSRY